MLDGRLDSFMAATDLLLLSFWRKLQTSSCEIDPAAFDLNGGKHGHGRVKALLMFNLLLLFPTAKKNKKKKR